MQSTRLPTIRELVTHLQQRDGVDAVLLLGRDGMPIDGLSTAGTDLELLAAHIPPLASAAEGISAAAGRGGLVSAVVEFERGLALFSTLSAETLLAVLLSPRADVGALIAEIRRHRSHIAALV